ncbi:MAG: hypothetical protein KDD67_03060 [Ignavibacteriae bacterium]|nr:hypothetical protein [Ignavibacteriota bacterium]MCB9217019.1 hypothetical protein [Ignavibacteria bacterium]
MRAWRTLLLFIFAITLAGCARECEGCRRSVQTGERNYIVTQYSGGVVVNQYRFKGIVNDAEDSDGYYWSIGDTLYEVSGDVLIQSWSR